MLRNPRPWQIAVLVAVLAAINAVSHLHLLDGWWFEDDPAIYAAIDHVPSPAAFFFDPAADEGAVGPNEMAPVLLASMWLDLAIADRSPVVAYAQSTAWYALAAGLLFFVALRLFGKRLPAFLVATTWLFLPSTTVVLEFLSARHYMIGLVFALASFLAAERHLVLYAVFTWLALISKELFPPALLALGWLVFASQRRWRATLVPVALAVAYAGYRFWMTEPAVTYRDLPLLGPWDTVLYAAKLTYMTLGAWAGVAVLGLAAVALVYALKHEPSLRRPTAIGAVVLLLAFATTYPVASAVSTAWRSLGTWFRTPFAINTLVILAVGLAWSRLPATWMRGVAWAATLVIAAESSHRTGKQWLRAKQAQRLEAEFVLDHEGELLFSWTEAFWYLPGITKLYPERRPAAFISRWPAVPDPVRAQLLAAPRIWTLEKGQVQAIDTQRMQEILATIPP